MEKRKPKVNFCRVVVKIRRKLSIIGDKENDNDRQESQRNSFR